MPSTHYWLLEEVRWAALGIISKVDISNKSIGINVFPIVQRINYPGYKSGEKYNDIALYRLKDPIKFSPTIRPICLHDQVQLLDNMAVSVTGWGRTFADESESDDLLKATIRYYNSSECTRIYTGGQNDRELSNGFNVTTMICGGDRTGKNDTCGGDSGGPMQIPMPETPCMWIQVGITSTGPLFCGDKLAIYTKVAYFLPWIQGIVWPDTKHG